MGPLGLITALRDLLGANGTLIMPSMSWDDDHPFDPKTTPCPEMGIIAETFWRCPGVPRSDSPHAFAAVGPLADRITAPHPIDPPHGLDSPVGVRMNSTCRCSCLASDMTRTRLSIWQRILRAYVTGERSNVTILEDGKPVRFEYREVDHCCQKFALVEGWLDDKQLQRHGTVGHGEARLARSRDIVNVVKDRLRAEETILLHPRGVDEECDEAWSSLVTESNVT